MASLTTGAAGSSSFSSLPQSSTDHQNHYTYEVFLSFRGEDTRFGFTDHLHSALCQRGIKTFRDDKLNRGEDISHELLRSIEDSRVSVIVFSETYAASRWCLDELVKILECRKSKGQKVRAVFYKVDPSDVRKQTGTFGDAFATLDQLKHKDSMDKWRAALKEAADLSGWPFKDGKYETEFINEIVVELCEGVVNPSCELHVATHPIGLQSQEVISRLLLAKEDIVRMVGIWGLGGIGKTTIAKDVFNSIWHSFDGTCFLADVRSSSVDRQAMAKQQETLLFDILRDSTLKVSSVDRGVGFIKTRMRHKKVLLVLDDVSDSSQLESLVPDPRCFGPGSRIFITTRDKRCLTAHQVDQVYEVKMLNDVQALNLFSWNAFKSNGPPDDYLELAKRAVRYAQGLPLALIVLGSHLFLRSKEEWEDTMCSWKGGDHQTKIQEVLRLSYDALDPNLKGYFLDIACFFRFGNTDKVRAILESCYDLKFSIGIARLQEKALIKIIGREESIWMHDLIEEMGKDIVYQESSDEPGERSRVWSGEDVDDILTNNTGTNKVIGLQVHWKSSAISFNAKSFSRMKKLKYISMRCNWMRNEAFSGEINYLSDQLRWLDWPKCPLKCFPSDFHAKKLAYLDISNGREITRLWQGRKNFSSLTHMILRGCKFLTELPDFRGIPNLEELDLTDCKSLVEVPDSLGFHDKLATLTVDNCSNLTKFPRKINWKSSEGISIKNCKLEEFPEVGEEMGSLRSMKLESICISGLHPSITRLVALKDLTLKGCQDLTTLPHNLYELRNLKNLTISCCPKLAPFPVIPIKMDSCLSKLELTFSGIGELDESIGNLIGLRWLCLSNCNNLRTLPCSIYGLQNLKKLKLLDCQNLVRFPTNPNILNEYGCSLSLPKLRGLMIINCGLSDCDFLTTLHCCETLEVLILSANNFVSLPGLTKFVKLRFINLVRCKRIRELPELPPEVKVYTFRWDSLELADDHSDDSSASNLVDRVLCKLLFNDERMMDSDSDSDTDPDSDEFLMDPDYDSDSDTDTDPDSDEFLMDPDPDYDSNSDEMLMDPVPDSDEILMDPDYDSNSDEILMDPVPETCFIFSGGRTVRAGRAIALQRFYPINP